jgi:hypothetical protein
MNFFLSERRLVRSCSKIARAHGGLDADVPSNILVGVFMVARLALSRLLKSRSR